MRVVNRCLIVWWGMVAGGPASFGRWWGRTRGVVVGSGVGGWVRLARRVRGGGGCRCGLAGRMVSAVARDKVEHKPLVGIVG